LQALLALALCLRKFKNKIITFFQKKVISDSQKTLILRGFPDFGILWILPTESYKTDEKAPILRLLAVSLYTINIL
jgi:hypothetical protein